MEKKTINITNEIYPVVDEVIRIAEEEDRTLSKMAAILLKEAVDHRNQQEQS